MRKTFAFNRILSFVLVMAMVIVMIPTSFFPQAADDADGYVMLSVKSGDVAVAGKMEMGTRLNASAVENPFALRATTNSLKNGVKGILRGTAEQQGITPSEGNDTSDESEILTYSQLDYVGFYDISLQKNGKDVQPGDTVTVTINNIDLSGVKNAKIIHILDSEEAIRDAQRRGAAIWVNDTRFVKAFSAEAAIAQKVTGTNGVVIIEEIDANVKNGNTISFAVNSFSIFAVVNDDDDTRLKVNFITATFDSNGVATGSTATVATIVIKETDLTKIIEGSDEEYIDRLVYDPGVNGQLPDDVLFRGWSEDNDYTVADAASNALTIAKVRTLIKEKLQSEQGVGTDLLVMDFYAMLYKQFTVTYFDEAGNVCLGRDYVMQRADGTEAELDYQVTLNYVPYGQFENFEGWKLKSGDKATTGDDFYDNAKANLVGIYSGGTDTAPGGTLQTDTVNGVDVHEYIYKTPTWTRIKGDIYLYAYSPEGNWLVFDENGKGGTYVAPQFVKKGETTIDPEEDPESSIVMQRYGYTFGGWYDTKDHADAHAADPSDTTGLFTFGQQMTENITVYASWIPNATANYTIIIWKQNVNGVDYDFGESVTLAGNVGTVISSATVSGTGNNAYVTVNGSRKQYTGFHYDHMDDTIAKIVPEGTSILNVYYNRNIVTLTFQHYSTGTDWSITYDTTGEIYGLVNGQHVRVYTNDNGTTWYTSSSEYVETTDLTSPLYALIDGAYTELSYDSTIGWYTTDPNQYSANTVGSPKYGFVNGQYVQLTERDGHYYISGTEIQYVPTTDYSNNGLTKYAILGRTDTQLVDGVYTELNRVNANANNFRYRIYTASNNTDYTMYGLINGNYVELTRRNNGSYMNPDYHYYYNNVEYTEQRYTRSWSGNTSWNSTTIYVRQTVDVETEYTGTVYTHAIPNEEPYYKLVVTNTPYTGNRYKSVGSGWKTVHTLEGLFGAPLSTSSTDDKAWPTDYWWYSSYSSTTQGSGTRTTFLDAFILPNPSSTSQTYYGFDGSGTNVIRFYKWDGESTFNTTTVTPTNTVTSSAGTFYITDKYNGYRAHSYSTNGTSWTTLGNKDSDGRYASVTNYTNLYIRFVPLEYNILYMDGQYVDGNNNPVIGYSSRGELHVIEGVDYDSDLSSYNKGGDNYYTPAYYAGFVFEGWYLDDMCTHPYTFTTMSEGITVYAKWRQVQYRVFLHPNAGSANDVVNGEPKDTRDMTLNWGSEGQAMNFRVSYGGTISVPTGLREEYVFAGWYLDPECTKSFIPATVLNDQAGTKPYDKTTDLTDDMDKWGDLHAKGDHTEPWNSDLIGYKPTPDSEGEDRFWITEKLDLYAKWRKKIVGANGLYVKYVTTDDEDRVGHFADGTANTNEDKTEYCDGDVYVDKAFAYGIAACEAPSADLHFRYWVIQEWDASANNGQGGFVDSDKIVYPGQRFETVYEYAQRIDVDPSDPTYNPVIDEHGTLYNPELSEHIYDYYMVLRAEYSDAVPLTTNLVFDANGGTFDTSKTYAKLTSVIDDTTQYTPAVTAATVTYTAIPINQHFNILPKENISREGYTFLGWAYTADATDPVYAPDFSALLAVDDLDRSASESGNDTSNTLYAIWGYSVTVDKVVEIPTEFAQGVVTSFIKLTDALKAQEFTVTPGITRTTIEGYNADFTLTDESDPKIFEGFHPNDKVSMTEAADPMFTTTYSVKIGSGTAQTIAAGADVTLTDNAVITITNTLNVQYLTIKKTVTNTAKDNGKTFYFDVTVNGETVQDIEVTSGGNGTVIAVPYGAEVIVHEDLEAGTNYENNMSQAQIFKAVNDQSITSMTADQTLTFNNERRTVKLTVKKIVADSLDPDDLQQDFTFTVNDGTPFTLKHNQTSDEIEVEIGAAITVTETAATNYSTSYIIGNVQTATDGNTANISGIYEDTLVTFTNARPTVWLTIKKTFESDKDETGDIQFKVTVNGEELSNPVTLTKDGGYTVKIGLSDDQGFVYGSTVKVEEITTGYIYENNLTVGEIFNVTPAQTIEVMKADGEMTFVNTRNSVTVKKVFTDSNVDGDDEKTFNVKIDYTAPDGTAKTETVSMKNSDEKEVYIKTGTTVTVTEPNLDSNFKAPVITTSDDGKTITVKNERDTVEVTVTKVVDQHADTTTEFDFTATATLDGKTVTLAEGDASFKLKDGGSKTITIPKGAILTVTEADNANFYTTVSGASDEAITANTTITFTNYKVQKVQVKKVFESNVADDDKIEFTIYVDYIDEAGTAHTNVPVTLKAGETSDEIVVRYGSNVKLSETAPNGFNTPEGTGTFAITEDKTGDNVLVVTNSRKTVKVTVTKKVVGTNGTFTFTASATLNNKTVTLSDATEILENAGSWEIVVPEGSILTVGETAGADDYNTYIDGTLDEDRSVTTDSLTENTTIAFKNVELVDITFVKAFNNKGITTLPEWTSFFVTYTQSGVTGLQTIELKKTDDYEATVTVEYGTAFTGIQEVLTTENNSTDKIQVGTVYEPSYSTKAVDGESDVTVTITNTVKNYTLTVKKITDDGAEGNFNLKLVTTNLTQNITDNSKSVAANDENGVTFTLPYGTTFTLVEKLTSDQQNYYSSNPTYLPSEGVTGSGTYTITTDGTITITNFRNPVVVKVTKVVVSDVEADLKDYVFEFAYTKDGVTKKVNVKVSKENLVSGNGTATAETEIPEGSTLVITESDADTDAFVVEYTYNGNTVTGTSVDLGKLTALEYDVTFTNTRKTFDVDLTKVVSGFTGTENDKYPIKVTVTFGEGDSIQELLDTTYNLVDTETGKKVTINDVPYGANILFVEDSTAKITINGVEYTIAEAFTTSITGTTSSDGYTGTLTNVTANGSVTYTNTRKTVNATVTKILDNKGVNDGWNDVVYKFDYTITDNGVDTVYSSTNGDNTKNALEVAAGETGTITGIPFGATITVTEDKTVSITKDGHLISELFTVSGDDGVSIVAAGTAPEFVIDNTRKIVNVTIVKNVLSDNAADIKDYTFNVTTDVASNYAGSDVTKSGIQTVTVGNNKTGSVTFPIPAGTNVTIVETGVSANDFDTFIDDATTKTTDYTKSLTDVMEAKTVTYVNRRLVTVTVKKIVDSTLNPDLGTYTFIIGYHDIDNDIDRNVTNNTANVTAFNTAASVETFKVPYGTTNLSVAEVLGSAADSFTTTLETTGATVTAGTNNQSATVATVNADTTITFTNKREMRTITVKKTVDSLLADDLKAYTFTYGYKYYAVSGEQTVANATVAVDVSTANPATATFQIPYDAHAFEISEPDNSGATTVLTTVEGTGSLANGTASDANRKYSVTANITADGQVSFTNKRVVYIVIEKVLDSLDSNRSFSFSYTYENPNDSDDTAHKGSDTQTVTVDSSTMTGDSALIEVPYGVKVTVTETTTDGYSTYVLVPYGEVSENTAVSGFATIVSGTETEPEKFVFTNHRVVMLTVNKKVDSDEGLAEGDTNSPVTEYEFTVTYDYNGTTGISETVKVTVADGDEIGDGIYNGTNSILIPYGATNVVITEEAVAGYDTKVSSETAGTPSGTEPVVNVYTLTNSYTEAATINYTNTRMVEVTVIKELDSEEDGASSQKFNYSYTYTGTNHSITDPATFEVKITSNMQGSEVIRVPYGVTLTINELLGDASGDYDTFWGVGTVGNTIDTGNDGTTTDEIGAVVDDKTVVKFSNKRMVNVKIIKTVDDPTLNAEEGTANNKYEFTYSYKYNNTTNTSDALTITVDVTSAKGETGYFRIPYNAQEFKVTESFVTPNAAANFDTTASSTGTTGSLSGLVYSLSRNVTAVNTDVTFNNQRMVEVTVDKTVESSEADDKAATYNFSYTYTRDASGNIAAAVNKTETKALTLSAGTGSFVVRMPYGCELSVTETDVDNTKFQTLHKTSDATTLAETADNTAALDAVVAAGETVSFVNRKLYTVTVRKHVDNTVNDIAVTDGLADAVFSFTYTVSGTVGYDTTGDGTQFPLKNYSENDSSTVKVITLPYGAVFALKEDDTAIEGTAYKVSDLFKIGYNSKDNATPVSITSLTANSTADVYNTRKTRDITVSKTLNSKVSSDFHAYSFDWTVDKWTNDTVTLTPLTDGTAVSTTITVPVGLEVTVTEDATTNPEYFIGMETTVKVGSAAAETDYEGVVAAGLGNVTVIFVNTRVTAELTIAKNVDQNAPNPDRTFIFSVDCDDETNNYHYHQIIMIKGSGSVTINQLQTGYIYTVTEITDWSWEFDATNVAVTTTLQGEDTVLATDYTYAKFLFVQGGTVTFTNEDNGTNWLRNEAWVQNILEVLVPVTVTETTK